MDPDAALARIRLLAVTALGGRVGAAHAELADCVHSLDEWITRGGFLPADWADTRRRGADRTALTGERQAQLPPRPRNGEAEDTPDGVGLGPVH